MTDKPDTSTASTEPRRRITLERVYDTDLQDVWDLWTTKDGIESWWGPGGFAVTVRRLDLRPGGERLAYVQLADFIPGVEPYDVATVVELNLLHRVCAWR